MRLEHATWQEVEEYLRQSTGIIIPTGSIEQHGPMGLIATDAICAENIAWQVAEKASVVVAPTLALAPAPFNLSFPGSLSLRPSTYLAVLEDVVASLSGQGFSHFYFLNAHGANLALLNAFRQSQLEWAIRIRSWWDFPPVNELRQTYYGDWEGMHATPSEVAITQAVSRIVLPGDAAQPPEKLTADFIRSHAGDKHGLAAEHRAQFPDGRVGSHSALARPEHGLALLHAAAAAVAEDVEEFFATERGTPIR